MVSVGYYPVSFYTDVRDFFKRAKKFVQRAISDDRRVYGGGNDYLNWKIKTFGYQNVMECERKNNLENKLWEKRNFKVLQWYHKKEHQKAGY